MKFDLKQCFSRRRGRLSGSSLGMGVFLAFVFAAFFTAALFARVTEPENPFDGEIGVDAEPTLLLCDVDRNENVYIPAPVAADLSDDEKTEETDDALTPEEEEPEEEPEDEPEPPAEEPEPPASPPESEQRQKQRPQTSSQRQNQALPGRSGAQNENAPTSDSGGIGGGESENGKKTDEIYFTTTIKDGETVTEPVYSFEIRHLKEELSVKAVTVSVNGEIVGQFNGSVMLKEGANVIRVKVDYVDDGGKTVASPFKDYTVNLDTQSLVIQTSLKDETVTRDQYPFTASASYRGEDVPLAVIFNGETVSGTGGNYRVRLKEGTNLFILSAEGGGLKRENQYTIVYQSDGIFDFETDLADGLVVTEPTVSFSVWMVNGVDAVLSVKHGREKLSGDGAGRFTVENLRNGENKISISAFDSGQNDQYVSRTYTVTFRRPEASEDNPFPDPDHSPTLQTIPNIESGYVTKNATFSLVVKGSDYRGNWLTANNMRLWLNDTEIRPRFQNTDGTEFQLLLNAADNTIKIFLKDEEGYTALYTYQLTYERSDGPIGQAVVSVEATTLGLGYIIPPTSCDIYSSQPASYVLKELLEKNGAQMIFGKDEKSLDSGFYLSRIIKDGITEGYQIPENLIGYLEEAGAAANDMRDPDSLGEKDFYSGSGWMVAVNGLYPNHSLDEVHLRDGDRLTIRYTLCLGMDVGGNVNSSQGNFPELFIEE